MVNKVRKLQCSFTKSNQEFQRELNETKKVVSEIKENAEHLEKDISSVNIIISDIDKQFAEKTGITNFKDMIFLWGAVALQCGRWIFIPAFDKETLTPTLEDRKDATKEGRKDKTKTGKELDKDREERNERKYITCKDIIALPVSYDAMLGTEDIVIPGVTPYGKNICGKNHHAATFGHDPILGHIFGTINIISRTITFRDSSMTTRRVDNPSGRTQIVLKEPYGIPCMLKDFCNSIKEDKERLVAGHLKQVLHMQSDKYTKDGLPIPLIPASMQQKLLKMHWNSKELEDVINGSKKGIAKQVAVAVFLNTSVGILHGFCYNECKDESLDLYSVRTRKIIATSNVIAEAINVVSVASGITGGILSDNSDVIKKSICMIDVGGYIECIHQVVSSKKLQEKIRREFLEKELFAKLNDNRYSFLEEAHYEQ